MTGVSHIKMQNISNCFWVNMHSITPFQLTSSILHTVYIQSLTSQVTIVKPILTRIVTALFHLTQYNFAEAKHKYNQQKQLMTNGFPTNLRLSE